MKLKKLNWSDFDQFKPCYSPLERYGEFSGNILDILNDERIPHDDKLWAATREGILDDKTLRLFACGCVREVWHLLADDRSKTAVEVAEKYAHRECSVDELNAARAAAWAAAWASASAAAWASAWSAARSAARSAASAAARSAARSAARDAARSAARSAAWSAARSASSDAARDAAWYAARDAAWINQLEILKNLINRYYEI